MGTTAILTPLERFAIAGAEIALINHERAEALDRKLSETSMTFLRESVEGEWAAAGVNLGAEGDPDWLLAARPSLPEAYATPGIFPLVQELAHRHDGERRVFFLALHEAALLAVDEEQEVFGAKTHSADPGDDEAIRELWPTNKDDAAHADLFRKKFGNQRRWNGQLTVRFSAAKQPGREHADPRREREYAKADAANRPFHQIRRLLNGHAAWLLGRSDRSPEAVLEIHEKTALLALLALKGALNTVGLVSAQEAVDLYKKDRASPSDERSRALLNEMLASAAVVEERIEGRESVLRFPMIEAAAQMEKEFWRQKPGVGAVGSAAKARESISQQHSPFAKFCQSVKAAIGSGVDDSKTSPMGMVFRDGGWAAFFGDAPAAGSQDPLPWDTKDMARAAGVLAAQRGFLKNAIDSSATDHTRALSEKIDPAPAGFFMLAEFLANKAQILAEPANPESPHNLGRLSLPHAAASLELPAAHASEDRRAFWKKTADELSMFHVSAGKQLYISKENPQWAPDFLARLMDEPVRRHSVEKIGRAASETPAGLSAFLPKNAESGGMETSDLINFPSVWLRVGRAPEWAGKQAQGLPVARLALGLDLADGVPGERSEQRLFAALKARGLTEPGWRVLTRFTGELPEIDFIAHTLVKHQGLFSQDTADRDKNLMLSPLAKLLNACADATLELGRVQALLQAIGLMRERTRTLNDAIETTLAVIDFAQADEDTPEERAVIAEQTIAQRGTAPLELLKLLDERLAQMKAPRTARQMAEKEADAPKRKQITRALADFAWASLAEMDGLSTERPAPAVGEEARAWRPRSPREEAERRMANTIVDLADWSKNCPEDRAGLPNKFGVSALLRRVEAWHARLAIQKAETDLKKTQQAVLDTADTALQRGDAKSREEISLRAEQGRWPAAVDKVSDTPKDGRAAWVAVGLCSEVELLEEGAAMRHCVGSYAKSCAKGISRIFSLRDEQGNRLATLDIRRRGEAGPNGGPLWFADQLRGPLNATISDTRVLALADSVVENYAEQAQRNLEKMAQILANREPAGPTKKSKKKPIHPLPPKAR